MNRQEWQQTFGILDEDMVKICAIKEAFNGTIIDVQDVPRTASGDPVAFSHRDPGGRTLLHVWQDLPKTGRR
jgi:hypothetical protein